MIPEETFITMHGTPTPPIIPLLIFAPLALGGLGLTGWLMGKATEALQTGVELGKVMTNMLLPLIPVVIGIIIMIKAPTEGIKKIGMLTMVVGGAIALIVAFSTLKK
jgi:hypothetical protein